MNEAKENLRDNLFKIYDNFKPIDMDNVHKKINEVIYDCMTEICDEHINKNRKAYIDALASKVVLNARRYKDER